MCNFHGRIKHLLGIRGVSRNALYKCTILTYLGPTHLTSPGRHCHRVTFCKRTWSTYKLSGINHHQGSATWPLCLFAALMHVNLFSKVQVQTHKLKRSLNDTTVNNDNSVNYKSHSWHCVGNQSQSQDIECRNGARTNCQSTATDGTESWSVNPLWSSFCIL